eukprot:458230-Pyramimonas_sp.AAC.1
MIVGAAIASGRLSFCCDHRRQAAGWISAQLARWYGAQKKLGHRPSEVGNLQYQMFGSQAKPAVKTKAHETKWLFKFFVDEFLPRHAVHLRKGRELLTTASYLFQWDTFLDRQPDVLDEGACASLQELSLMHLVSLEAADVARKPKHHLFLHMTERTHPYFLFLVLLLHCFSFSPSTS